MKHLFLVLAFLGFAGSANASILIEPSVAVDMSKNDFSPKGGGTDMSGKATLIDPGVRLGYESMIGLFVAADYQMAMSGKYTLSNAPGAPATKMSRSQLWLDVGFDAPLLFRVWAGYALVNKMALKVSGIPDINYTGGSSLKLGVGFNVIPLLSINIEYLMNNWSKVEIGGLSQPTSDAYDTSKGNAILVGVSIPLTI
jgi:hypothetical protein